MGEFGSPPTTATARRDVSTPRESNGFAGASRALGLGEHRARGGLKADPGVAQARVTGEAELTTMLPDAEPRNGGSSGRWCCGER